MHAHGYMQRHRNIFGVFLYLSLQNFILLSNSLNLRVDDPYGHALSTLLSCYQATEVLLLPSLIH